jgi:L-ascorbate metabolism protein UlaG (beta-lactamase superfamily)
LRLRWLGTSCFHVDLGGLEVLMDPYLESRSSFNPPPVSSSQLVDVDLVAITHGHYDHFADAPKVLASPKPILVASRELCNYAKQSLGLSEGRLIALEAGGRAQVDGCVLEATKAIHLSPLETIRWLIGDFSYTPSSWEELRRMYLKRLSAEIPESAFKVPVGPLQGYVLESGGFKLWNVSETKLFEELKEVAGKIKAHVALVSAAGGYEQHSALLASWIKPRVVVPYQFDRIFEAQALLGDVRLFKSKLAELEPSVEVLTPKPGEWYSF